MAKPFKTLLEQIPQERRERIADRTEDALIEMTRLRDYGNRLSTHQQFIKR